MDFTKQLLNKNIPFVDILVVPAEVLWETSIILLKMKTAIEVVVHIFIISRRNLESTLISNNHDQDHKCSKEITRVLLR